MIQGTCTTRQRRYAGSSIQNRQKLLESEKGGGMAVIFLGLMITLLVLLVVVNAADYALYSSKRNLIAKAIDYSVCAAIQEIDGTASEEGLSRGYDDTTGNLSVDGIFIKKESADEAFFSTFQSNTGIERNTIKDKLVIVILNPVQGELEYIIGQGAVRDEGEIPKPEQAEGVINDWISAHCNTNDPGSDGQVIFVNGNPDTNEFKSRPYYMVFIRNYQIDGLFRKRSATFVGFASARVDRR